MADRIEKINNVKNEIKEKIKQENDENEKIHELWKYLELNQNNINLKEINIFGTKSYELYENIKKLFDSISPDIMFYIFPSIIPIKGIVENILLDKLLEDTTSHKVLYRINIVLSSVADPNKIDIINRIYDISTLYYFDEIVIIKHTPCEINTDIPNHIEYRIDNNILHIYINDILVNDDIKKLKIKYYCLLEKIVGEFNLMKFKNISFKFLKDMNILYDDLNPRKKLTEFQKEFNEKKCSWCELSENNINLKSFENKNYCTYCYKCIRRLK